MAKAEELPNSPIREEMVQTAVKFLENPNVISTPLATKQKFLQRKGLTDEEIQQACERSGAYTLHEQQKGLPTSSTNAVNTLAIPSYPQNYNQMHLTLFERIREIVHNLAIFSIVAYVIHKFYQKYIAPFLFGKKKKSVEDSVEELDKTMKNSIEEVKDELQNVKVEVFKTGSDIEDRSSRLFQELKSEIASLKGLLLNRKTFPSANTPIVPPSIPAWQMASVAPEHTEGEHEEHKEDLEESASGSGSSEHEHGMKTSESSLEIITKEELNY